MWAVPSDAERLADAGEEGAYHMVAPVPGDHAIFRDAAVGVLPVFLPYESAVLKEPKKAPQRSTQPHDVLLA